jgi:hypothetical protein
MVSLVTKFRDTLPISSLIFILTLVFNILPFAIFKYFSLKKRYFDDFMRLMAVVQGMFWMQASFLTLFINQLVTEFSTRPIADFRLNVQVLLVYILGAVTITYLVSFGIVAQKHFWNISYGRTLWCYALTVLAFFVIMLLMFSPVIAINMVIALGNRRY